MTRPPPKNPLIVVLGATGTGKSQLAVDLAVKYNGEIINGDAMQMYDGLPIITNKITVEEQQGIPHHLLGFIALDEETWRVDMFKDRASKIIKEIWSRGRLPIVVGGTHYYTQSLLFDESLVTVPPCLEEEPQNPTQNKFLVLDGPTEGIVAQLRQVDPIMADRWHPNERRKLRRSLEIYLTTGKKASDIYEEQKKRKTSKKTPSRPEQSQEEKSSGTIDRASTLLFWVHSESDTLKERLDTRVDKMVKSGLLDEVKSMNAFLEEQRACGADVDLTRGIWVSIGWKEFLPYLKAITAKTTTTAEEVKKIYDLSVEQTKSATRQYAKRQVRWIRLKLINALLQEDLLDRLFLLDGSDISKWHTSVSDPAVKVTANFLKGYELPSPQDFSPMAKEHLTPDEGASEEKDTGFRQECALCHVTVVAEHQWLQHLKSRRHRALEKKRLRNMGNGRSRQVQEGVSITDNA
ncbi:IPP transferase-domain-containing protein [Tricladium varicosporioides]|nr:IPP transferase-domain-containing protein [Hymenoscyphus varicosporioides]